MQGVDRLFLLTPNSERQVGYILQAVAAARRAGVRRIVRVSVMGADAEPGIILGRQHFAAKREIRASGIGWAMLRPTFFMDNFIRYYGVDPPKDSQVYRPNGDGKAAWVDPTKGLEQALYSAGGGGFAAAAADRLHRPVPVRRGRPDAPQQERLDAYAELIEQGKMRGLGAFNFSTCFRR